MEDLACKNGQYRFKKSYRFKKGKDKLTPLAEIENYTFHVRDIKTVQIMNKQVMLIFLTRNEDGEKIVLRLQLESSRGNNFLSNAMFEYKEVYNGLSYVDNGPRYVYAVDRINLAYINSDSLSISKKRYAQKNIVIKHTTFRGNLGKTVGSKIDNDFDELVEVVNNRKIDFNHGDSFFCMGIGFAETFEESLNRIPCAKLRTSRGEFIDIPLCYFNKETSRLVYLLPNFFITEDVYKEMELARYGLKPLIDKYVGKDVYYGLDKTFPADKLQSWNLQTDEKYNLEKGRYKSLNFIVDPNCGKRRNTMFKYPFAILEDSLGIQFKVCIENDVHSSTAKNCFETYFTDAHVADSIIAERDRIKFENALRQMKRLIDLKEEFGDETGFLLFGCSDEEVERFRGFKKEFGEKYGLYLIKRSNEDVDRFRRLRKKYGSLTAVAILGGGYEIGWTEDMVIESLGYPDDVNRSVGSWGVHEQWIYRYEYSHDATYLYFENGKLRSYQE